MHAALHHAWLVLEPWRAALAWAWVVYAIWLAVWIVLQKRSPVSTLTWVITLVLMPVLGLLIYRVFGPQRIKRQNLRRSRSEDAFIDKADVRTLLRQREEAPDWARAHSTLIERACGLPMSSCHSARYLQNGHATLEALLEAIGQAQHHIHLEYYIFEHDESGKAVLQALHRKASQGVKVRLLVDAVGSPLLSGRRGKAVLKALLDAGGEFSVFHPTRFDRHRPLVNLRSHRKIAIIDGRIGFTGGINVCDTENERVNPDTAFRDTHLRLEGAVVSWLQYLFVQDWVYATQQGLTSGDLFVAQAPGPIHAQVVASGPDSPAQAIHRAMIDTIDQAEERVWLVTPYFVPTEPALTALTNAALRGVDVRIMVPRMSDSRVVTWAARSYYDELTRVGAQIYEYGPRMLHAKTLLADHRIAHIGTANFDYRSFMLNFELSVVLFDEPANHDLARMFEADAAQCTRVPRRRELPFLPRLAEASARLLAPLL
ncbi:cardiolipin synthase [Comamonas serinivorans]|uniref:Cardiolipin synthase n=1 Tax=Comamonas serinivorans TaxID=1082851 RepID=A0A1Y0EQQ9_9BURK|nr:cardiolipin synthase [Comamonas serinivorans]ARU05838.1 cardiolipin synthase [Comamonas serinivorans]